MIVGSNWKRSERCCRLGSSADIERYCLCVIIFSWETFRSREKNMLVGQTKYGYHSYITPRRCGDFLSSIQKRILLFFLRLFHLWFSLFVCSLFRLPMTTSRFIWEKKKASFSSVYVSLVYPRFSYLFISKLSLSLLLIETFDNEINEQLKRSPSVPTSESYRIKSEIHASSLAEHHLAKVKHPFCQSTSSESVRRSKQLSHSKHLVDIFDSNSRRCDEQVLSSDANHGRRNHVTFKTQRYADRRYVVMTYIFLQRHHSFSCFL